ncbi:MAG: flagellar basal-body rod protein FlgG [Oceanospirillaceae bacterium]|nr:flagellar basal-body rod protein FlgG [Oceanospirillaceae bacterium]
MNGALYVAKTGLSAQDMQLKVISNNLANVSTVGFKKGRAVFEDLLYQIQRAPGAESADGTQLPSGLQLGNGVRIVGTQKQFTAGEVQITDNPFDVAINGNGFFQVTLPTGEIGYTRNGQFHLNGDGELTTSEGLLIEPAITLPDEVVNFSVGVDGSVSVTTAGNTEPQNIGQLTLAGFVNPAGLLAVGSNLFTETASSGAPLVANPGESGLGATRQNMLEASNVNAVEELVNLITTQRAYEINSKVISTADEMLGFINQQL